MSDKVSAAFHPRPCPAHVCRWTAWLILFTIWASASGIGVLD